MFAESFAGEKARQIIGKAGLRRSDLEDVRQQLLLYVVSHLPGYDPRRGTPEAHVTMLLTTAVAMLLRERRAQKRGGGRSPAPLDELTHNERPDGECLSTTDAGRRLGCESGDVLETADLRFDLGDAVASVPLRLRSVVYLLACGETVASIARLPGRSRRRVYNDIHAVEAHLRSCGLEDR